MNPFEFGLECIVDHHKALLTCVTGEGQNALDFVHMVCFRRADEQPVLLLAACGPRAEKLYGLLETLGRMTVENAQKAGFPAVFQQEEVDLSGGESQKLGQGE